MTNTYQLPEEVSAIELLDLFARGADFQLVDVREDHEWQDSHIEGATWIVMNKFVSGSAFSELAKDKPIIFQCRSGVRSRDCMDIARAAGFSNTSNLTGGILAWYKAGGK
jgi:adenylyltransferase/sulfurtransferase